MNEDNTESLMDFARSRKGEYLANRPFPHVVIDGVFPGDLLHNVVREIEALEMHQSERMFYGSEKKFTTNNLWRMGPTTRSLLLALNSSVFCRFIESLTGYEGIISDPYLDGGGIHEIKNDGFLKVHSDFNWSKKLRLDRRVNLLLFLNEYWNAQWRGNLELWNRDMTEKIVDVAPKFNTMVIFSTNDISFHGHPDPIACPEGQSRKSLALYYYTNGREDDKVGTKRTNTNYQERPSERFRRDSSTSDLLKKIIPPILFDFLKTLRR